MQPGLSTQKTGITTQHTSHQQTNATPLGLISLSLMIAFPLIVMCALVGYRKYQSIVLQQRIQRLNRIWQQNSNHPLA